MRSTNLLRRVTIATLGLAVAAGVTLIGDTATAAPATPRFGPAIDAYADYDRQDTCDPTDKPGAVDLRNLLNQTYGTHADSIGRACVGDPSEHKEGRALDYGFNYFNTAQRAKAEDLLGWLLATDQYGNQHAMARRLGLMYIIWNHQIWGAYEASSGWRPYACGDTPSSCHTNHIHFSFSWDGALRRTTWWTGRLNGGGIAVTGDVAVVTSRANLLALFRRGSDNAVWGVSQLSVGGSYGAWSRLSSFQASSHPSSLVAPNGSIVVFARGTDNRIYGVSQLAPGGSYGSFAQVGSGPPTVDRDPSVAIAPGGQIVVYATGTDGDVWGLSQLTQGGSYGAWARIIGPGFVSSPAAVLTPSNLLAVFARSTDYKIYGASQLAPGGSYGGFMQIGSGQPTFFGDPSVAIAPGGQIVVYAMGTDGYVWGLSQLTQGGSYGAWARISGAGLASSPAPVLTPSNLFAVFARGTDNKIYGVSQLAPGGSYGTFTQVGSGQPTFTGDPSATVAPGGQIVVYARATDGHVWGLSQLTPGGSYGAWTRVGS